MPTTDTKTRNPFTWLFRYLRESKQEMGKVTWPNRQDTIKYSIICIGLAIGVAVYFTGLDWIFSRGFTYLLSITS